jgi:hypothetical protein
MYRKRVNISTVLAGQRLGITEVDDDIWRVSFVSCDRGCVDLAQKTSQPLDTPFAPRVSPMPWERIVTYLFGPDMLRVAGHAG